MKPGIEDMSLVRIWKGPGMCLYKGSSVVYFILVGKFFHIKSLLMKGKYSFPTYSRWVSGLYPVQKSQRTRAIYLIDFKTPLKSSFFVPYTTVYGHLNMILSFFPVFLLKEIELKPPPMYPYINSFK